MDRRPLRALLVASYISWFGNGLTIVAVPLYVLRQTGSPLYTGLAGFANTLPMALGGLVGGVVVDRLGGRVVSAGADLLAGVLILLVPLLAQTSGLPFGFLLVLIAARTLVDTPGSAARLAMLEPLAIRGGGRLESANAWFSGAQRTGLIIAPVCATLLAQVTDPSTVLYVDAATFAVSGALVWGLTPRVAVVRQSDQTGFARDLRDGLSLLARTPVLRAIVTVVVVTNFIDDALAPVVLPLFSRDVLGDANLVGLLVGLFGAGAVVGTFAYIPSSRGLLHNRFATFVGAFGVIALMRAALAFGPPVALAFLVLFVLGLAAGPLNPLITTVLQEVTPSEVQGRVLGVVLSVAFVAAPFGILVQSWLIEQVGITTTLGAFAGVYGLTVLYAFFNRGLRTMPQPAKPSYK